MMIMKNGKIIKVALLVACVFTVSQAYGKNKEPVRIGVPTSLTGAYSSLGEQVKLAINLAVDEANSTGGVDGRPVEVKYLDTQTKAELARRQSEKLALTGYNLLIGTIASGEALAIAPMLPRWNALYISTINKADRITGKDCSPRVFRVDHPDYSDEAVVSPWLGQQSQQKWAIVASDTAWGRNSAESFAKAAKANGKQVVANVYPPLGTNDFAAYIQQVASSGAKGVWVALAGRDATNFAVQADRFGLSGNVLTAGVSYMTDSSVETVGEPSRGVWGVINYSSTIDTPENKEFVKLWKKHYPGTTPSNFSGETYIGMQVLFQSIEAANSVKPSKVAAAMEGATFDTLYGKVKMRAEDHQLVVPNYFGVVGEHDGKLMPLVKVTVDSQKATPGPDKNCRL